MLMSSCDMCGVTCTSVMSMRQHVMGRKHRNKLQLYAPEQLKHIGRLQYFLDRYVKDHPVLGLEYVVEKQDNSSYTYTCMLCEGNRKYEWHMMALHVTDLPHTKRYVLRHHGTMTGVAKWMIDAQVTAIAEMIQNMYGRRQICVEHTADDPDPHKVASSGSRDAIQDNNSLPSTSDDLARKCTTKTLPQYPAKLKRKSTLHYVCRFCSTTFNSAFSLCQHMLGENHQSELGTLLPEHLKEVDRLNYFLGNELKDFPVLGLEYIVERKVGSLCDFSCQLCRVDTTLQQIIFHILQEDHIERYIRMHHSNLVINKQKFNEKNLYWRAMYNISTRIVQLHGRKEIQAENGTIGDLSMAEWFPESDRQRRRAFEYETSATLPSNHDRGISSYSEMSSLPCLDESHERYSYKTILEKSEIDGPPSVKRGRLDPEGDQDALFSGSHLSECRSSQDESHEKEMDNTTSTQELEFRTNDHFFEYLANFVIKNDEDAEFIQKIIQNCIRALMSFQEEEKEKASHEPETSLVYTSRPDQETLDISVYKTDSCPSGPESTSSKDASNPFTDSFQENDITDFLNNIKHMDESEVVDIFRKIATTNPKFQGMNIPTVIRFLKNSSRLNNA